MDYRVGVPSASSVSSQDKGRSQVSDSYVLGLRRKFRVSQDVHFYAPRSDGRADQPSNDLIEINKVILEAELRFPLHPTISHLLAAWGLSITQITPNGWCYILATMRVLGQARLL